VSTAHSYNAEMMAPPATRKIQVRSLIVGIVFSVVAIIIGFFRPDEFFRGYLLAFMAWLGVTLGSMAVLMIRHLTGGGWGTVIRRVMGAAMRCIPLMTILFVPILIGMPRLYIWARPLNTIGEQHLREHKVLSFAARIHHSRRSLFCDLESLVIFTDQVVARAGPAHPAE